MVLKIFEYQGYGFQLVSDTINIKNEFISSQIKLN